MNFEKIAKGKTTSFNRLPITNQSSTNQSSPDSIRRNHSETLEPNRTKIETCRKSTISFNFDIGMDSDDILTSVLAVMDKLNTTRLNDDFANQNIETTFNAAAGLCASTTNGAVVNPTEERIYDEGTLKLLI